MKPSFFPRDKLFWQYHCSALLLLVLAQGAIMFFWREERLFNAIAACIWIPSYTCGVLLFRYFYKKYELQKKSMAKQILWVFLHALIVGIVITVIVLGIVLPISWDFMLKNPAIVEHKMSIVELILQMAIGNTFQNQLLICAWVFIYINISGGRRIREAEINNLRLQNSLKEAQLVNLASQLNPHFLFNAINNIRFTIYEDATKADTMLTGLSEMLRYSLERSKQDKVRLSEELEVISLYIDLIKVQMEDRLQFSLKVAPSFNNYLIPPMTLQLLVENAVKHGIDKLRHGGGIELTAKLSEQQLIFKVNNSCGDNKPLLSSEAVSNNIGIGLINIQERLRLLYGDKASLLIEKTSNNFSVILSVPQESGI